MSADALYGSLLKLAKKRGIHIIDDMDLPVNAQNLCGLCIRLGDREVITINPSLPPKEKCITLAHELAHAVLHDGSDEAARYWIDPQFRLQAEDQADAFTARLISFLSRRLAGKTA